VKVVYSPNTGRIRYTYLNKERLATLRPTDGMFSLSLAGAKRIIENSKSARCIVTVQSAVSKFIGEGGDVFAAHVTMVDDDVRAKDEVIVVNEDGKVLAVGRTFLSAEEMRAFKRGVAVKVRRGNAEEG
jgi:7-cyano-7-deazaguanine tRNA-ribosyltransferase